MGRPVHIVLSVPPATVGADEYASWYNLHVAEILETPGFAAARCYRLGPASADRPPVEFGFAAFYELDGPADEAFAHLGGRMDAGEMTIPDWFGEILFASFDGRALEDEELTWPEHAYLVLSHAPSRFTTEEFYGWYYAHARENMTSEGFDTLWRYALTPATLGPDLVGRATHAAIYEVHGELAALRSALVESAQARRVDIPAWMPEGEFVSWECFAAGPARTANGGS